MAKIVLISGSVFGAATLTADEIEEQLTGVGHEVTRPDPPAADALTDESQQILIVCTSSTGNGDLPDELVPLYTSLVTEYPKIIHLKFAVVALGDSSYETFCGGGLSMHAALTDIGAQPLAEPLQIDALEESEPENIAPDWVVNLVADHLNDA
ncbi:MAG: flavodoxin domain-containing protein [Pseudomonadota bacterium]